MVKAFPPADLEGMAHVRRIDAPAWRYPGYWVITPKSFLANRVIPDHEFVYHPPAGYEGDTLDFYRSDRPAPSHAMARPSGLKAKLKARFERREQVALPDRYIVDLRHQPYANWSHQMNGYLPIVAELRRDLGEPLTVVFHAAMAGYIVRLYEYFGFEVVRTNGPVLARRVAFQMSRPTSSSVFRPLLVASAFEGFDFAPPSDGGDYARIFLSRKDRRRIVNEPEIEALLSARGYRKLYLEEHSPADQIAIVRGARHIVCIHGAALAPLQFHPRGSEVSLIELLPAGHVAQFYRAMADQLGVRYIAVRGREKPEYVNRMYETEGGIFNRFSLDDFELDPSALELALKLRHDGIPPFDPEGLRAPD